MYANDTEFNDIKFKLEKSKSLMNSAYKKYQLYKNESEILRRKLEEMCDHNWIVDDTVFDDRTVYICSKCGK